MVSLLATRRFGPLFATQFLGAFNDNLYKTAMLFLITYRLMAGDLTGAATLVTLAGGLFILPFFPFSALAGQLADAVDKARIARMVKTAEIAIMAVGAFALSHDSVPLLMIVLFLMGLHSTIFGPVKYAILPQHLGARELLGGTGLVEAGTFLAILLAQILGGLLPSNYAAQAVIGVALLGWVTARFIPPAPPLAAAPRVDWNPVTSSRAVLKQAFANRDIRIAIIAISWFWALGAVYTSAFIPLVKGTLGADGSVATLFLAAFSIGIAAGSIGVARLLRGKVSGRAAPWAAAALALFSIELYFAVGAMPHGGGSLTVAQVFAQAAGWRILIDLAGLAVAGGVFSVPLYAILQTAGGAGSRSRAVAANNIVNSALMVAAALLAGAAVSRGVPLPVVLLVTGLTALPMIPLLLRLRDVPAAQG